MLVVQRITTEWTKASRGGSGADTRNATPDATLWERPPFVGQVERQYPIAPNGVMTSACVQILDNSDRISNRQFGLTLARNHAE